MNINKEINENKIYTVIGSIETPNNILKHFRYIGRILAYRGYLLRSGGAPGADTAFELGCKDSSINNNFGGDRNIFLPWENFNNNKSKRYYLNSEAFELAKMYLPYWNNLSFPVKKLMARNGYQVLGTKPISNPIKSDFVVCWTKNGKLQG